MLRNYEDFNDSELLMMVKEENNDAKDILYDKYQYIINIIIKKYINASYKSGIEYKDFYQEALLGFADAIDKYDETKEASLPTFISLCVQRRISGILQKANRQKNKISKESLSIDYTYDDNDIPLREKISDNNENNPLDNMTSQEYINELLNASQSKLSSFENEVFKLMLSEYNYTEIAKILNESPKKIDNTMQRIKKKMKAIIDRFEMDK